MNVNGEAAAATRAQECEDVSEEEESVCGGTKSRGPRPLATTRHCGRQRATWLGCKDNVNKHSEDRGDKKVLEYERSLRLPFLHVDPPPPTPHLLQIPIPRLPSAPTNGMTSRSEHGEDQKEITEMQVWMCNTSF